MTSYHNAEEREDAIIENELLPAMRLLAAGGIVSPGDRSFPVEVGCYIPMPRLLPPESAHPHNEGPIQMVQPRRPFNTRPIRAKTHWEDAPIFASLIFELDVWPQAAGHVLQELLPDTNLPGILMRGNYIEHRMQTRGTENYFWPAPPPRSAR